AVGGAIADFGQKLLQARVVSESATYTADEGSKWFTAFDDAEKQAKLDPELQSGKGYSERLIEAANSAYMEAQERAPTEVARQEFVRTMGPKVEARIQKVRADEATLKIDYSK